MPTAKPISLDGSTLEGGGQLVRVAFSLSAITGIPVNVYNIRANRMSKSSLRSSGKGRGARKDEPANAGQGQGSRKADGGAKESHLAALLWLAGQCGAYVEGAEVGSREVTFIPGAGDRSGKAGKGSESALVGLQRNVIHLERPGSVCLILQCILPYLLFSPPSSASTSTDISTASKHATSNVNTSTPPIGTETEMVTQTVTEVTLHGGTNVSKAMSTDYVQHVFLPMLRRIIRPTLPKIQLETIQRGWAGNASEVGEVKVRVTRPTDVSVKMDTVNAVDRGDIEKISVILVADGEGTRQALLDGIYKEIVTLFGPDIPIEVPVNEDSGDIRRLYVLLVAHTTNGYRLGRDFLGSGRRPKNAAEQKKINGECVRTVARDLNAEIKRGGCVDEFMQDQIVMFQALARGKGRVDGGSWRESGSGSGSGSGKGEEVEVGDEEGSLHARTVRWVCEKVLTGKNLGDGRSGVQFGKSGLCTGVGWS